MKRLLIAGLLLLALVQTRAEVVGKEVEYKAGETTLKGYLAVDNANNDKRPAVLVVHEWWGHNEYARKRARMLAELGYVALAVDMYGDGKTVSHPEDAGKMAGEVRKNMAVGEARFRAAMDFVRQQPQTDAGKLGAIGYCFGGSVVQHMARIGEDLAAVVSFHGSLASTTKAEPGKVKARILICNGAEDPMITAEAIKGFEDEMSAAGAKFSVVNYKGAKHSFTNPDADKFGEQFQLPLAYDKAADEQSWNEMKKTFREVFAK